MAERSKINISKRNRDALRAKTKLAAICSGAKKAMSPGRWTRGVDIVARAIYYRRAPWSRVALTGAFLIMISRREFIRLSLLVSALPLLENSPFASYAQGKTQSFSILAAHTDFDINSYQTPKNYTAEVIPGFIRTMNLRSGAVASYEVPLYAHVYEQNPVAPEIIAGAGKWTTLAIIFDLRASKVVCQIKAPEGVRFFGHCSFSTDGKWLYLTADSEKEKRGLICIVDTKNWKISDVVPSGGRFPHECLMASHDELCIVNSFATREESSIVFMNTKDFSVIESITTPVVAHVAKMNSKSYVASGYMKGRKTEVVKIDRASGIAQNFTTSTDYPKEALVGEGLSVASLDSRFAAITLPNKNALMIWDTEKNQFKLVGQGTSFMGAVSYDNTLYLNAGENGQLYKIEASNNANDKFPQKLDTPKITFANGRHLRLIST